MPAYEWTKMAIASAVAVIAMSYLAIDAGLVNTSVVTKRIEVVKASISDVGMGQNQLAFTVQPWGRRDQQKPALEHCLAVD